MGQQENHQRMVGLKKNLGSILMLNIPWFQVLDVSLKKGKLVLTYLCHFICGWVLV